jgi:3-oxoadipate enol-lactonase
MDGYINCSAVLAGFDPLDRLPAITTPTLVVVGAEDASTPLEMAEQIHERIPSSELVVLEGAAHLSNIDQADAFNEAVLRFLTDH